MPDSDLIRFDQFMAEALYGPRGYYTSQRQILGARGDFTTTPKLTPSLASRLARWIKEAWKRQGRNLPVIELGPGDGTLARDIRQHLGFFQRRQLNYHLVEISPHLRERQKKALGGKGHWHETLEDALKSTGHEALIISNEFFDAFPVRIFRESGEELFLDQVQREHWQTCDQFPDSALFKKPPQRFEVAESIQQFYHEQLSQWQRGEMLAIDYGGDAREIFHRRPLGTLRAYFQHQRLLPPEAYQNVGHQDLTVDIHFPDLIRWGNQIGINTQSLITQAEFLDTNDHEGAGGAFKVLHQTKER
ncbi:SAM-dependent methyltransferase [Akkermansiaceae bacterium]|nr:SAM-dependent methyltransferase [Akkermansiaceae bacterium]